MMRILGWTVLIGCVLGLAAGPAAATLPETNPPAVSATLPAPSASLLQSGLLDLSRLDISHSLNYGVSSSRYGTNSGGLWVTRLGYRLADPLSVSMDIGAVLDTNGHGPVFDEKNIFLRGFNLDYQPSRAFRIHISYLNQPPNSGLGYPSPGRVLGYRPWTSLAGPDR